MHVGYIHQSHVTILINSHIDPQPYAFLEGRPPDLTYKHL